MAWLQKRFGTFEQSPEEDATGFTGGDRKVWLYINRVSQHVTPSVIEKYIKNKPGFESVEVIAREIPSMKGKLKRFVVTAPLYKKDQM